MLFPCYDTRLPSVYNSDTQRGGRLVITSLVSHRAAHLKTRHARHCVAAACHPNFSSPSATGLLSIAARRPAPAAQITEKSCSAVPRRGRATAVRFRPLPPRDEVAIGAAPFGDSRVAGVPLSTGILPPAAPWESNATRYSPCSRCTRHVSSLRPPCDADGARTLLAHRTPSLHSSLHGRLCASRAQPSRYRSGASIPFPNPSAAASPSNDQNSFAFPVQVRPRRRRLVCDRSRFAPAIGHDVFGRLMSPRA